MEFEPFYTIREVAEMMGVTVSTVNEWIRKGKIHAITITPRHRIIRKKDLDEFDKARLDKKEEQRKKYLDYQREYFKRNRERLLKKRNEWNAKNREKHNAYKREYYLKNKDKINAHRRERRRKLKEAK